MTTPPGESRHFIQRIIDEDIASGKWGAPGDRSVVRTRFPPEPNGYLHIGHAKAIRLSSGLAREYGGSFNLRFDDTNPVKEEQEYVDSITADVRWLTGREGIEPLFASDYFPQMYVWAVELIEKGLAYVDEQTAEQIRDGRGTLTEPGEDSPYRDRRAGESLDLFEKMRSGGIEDGAMVLRAKIDMASPNMNLRDPVMYRVLNKPHHRTGDAWHIYPMYDWAHGLEDSIEGITHSLCTLEFENHRPLYDWFIDAINRDRPRNGNEPIHHPQQIEFSRLNLNYTVMSKRMLLELVQGGHVEGWDDPRMPTISGHRRRGYTPESIRSFADETGVTKFNAVTDVGRLENAVREHLNRVAPRRMCVLDPVKVVITNWGEGGEESRTEWMEAVNNPEDASAGTRKVPFTRELYIEREDFMEDAPKKFFRLTPGGEVRLRYAYWVRCEEVVKDSAGEIVELRCTYDPQTKGGESPPPDAEGKVRKVKGTLHWVSARHAAECDVRLFDRLFAVENPAKKPKDAAPDWSFLENLNHDSLRIVRAARLEPNWGLGEGDAAQWSELPESGPGAEALRELYPDGIYRVQFERHGYFCIDAGLSKERPVFNRTVPLRDSWSKGK